MARGNMTHGSKSKRQHGSIGMCATPARVFPGLKMAGHMGNKRIKTRKLKVQHLEMSASARKARKGVSAADEGGQSRQNLEPLTTASWQQSHRQKLAAFTCQRASAVWSTAHPFAPHLCCCPCCCGKWRTLTAVDWPVRALSTGENTLDTRPPRLCTEGDCVLTEPPDSASCYPTQVIKVDQERGAIVVHGSVPGKPGNVLEITPAKVTSGFRVLGFRIDCLWQALGSVQKRLACRCECVTGSLAVHARLSVACRHPFACAAPG